MLWFTTPSTINKNTKHKTKDKNNENDKKSAQPHTLVAIAVTAMWWAAGYAGDPYCQASLPQYVAPEPAGSRIEQVVSVSRHGDRSPLAVLPHEREESGVRWECGLPVYGSVGATAGYAHEYVAPAGPYAARVWKGNCTGGQLTVRGGEQCYAMGRALREIYVDKLGLLPREYDGEALYIESSEFERTRESMMSMMLGLYPPATRNGKVVRYRVQSSSGTQLCPNTNVCPRLARLEAENENRTEWRARMAALRPVLAKLHRIGGTAGLAGWDKERTVGSWHDTLRARACHGLPLPCKDGECVTAEEAQQVFDQADYECMHLLEGDECERLAIGTFAQRIADIFNATVEEDTEATEASGNSGKWNDQKGKNKNEKNEKKNKNYAYLHFSAHDSTIQALLTAFKNNNVFPPYASTLVFELWKAPDSRHLVRILYNGEPIKLRECTAVMCPFEEFQEPSTSGL